MNALVQSTNVNTDSLFTNKLSLDTSFFISTSLNQFRDELKPGRNPTTHEVVEYLSDPSDIVKANAAAYLQHLSYRDDNVKQQTRLLGGIPALVLLVLHPLPEVHRNACGALRNLSYGRANNLNKHAIKDADGIKILVNLLRIATEYDIHEVVSGTLWNLSSCSDLKRSVLDDAVESLVECVLVPHAKRCYYILNTSTQKDNVSWSLALRNVLGVLRNVSSAGEYCRNKLRRTPCLVASVIDVVRAAIGRNEIDNKSVENCVCLLRNLSYACQEIDDPMYLVRRSHRRYVQLQKQGNSVGCFSKKRCPTKYEHPSVFSIRASAPTQSEYGAAALLWQPEILRVYLPLLVECTNPETLEAAVGAIQNLAACDWQPSVDIRSAVRREKLVPVLVDLLKLDSERVVCVTATALRNLAIDSSNKQLIGKYGMHLLVARLPAGSTNSNTVTGLQLSDDTHAAIIATIYDIINDNVTFARVFMEYGAIQKLLTIVRCHRDKNSTSKVYRFTAQLLNKLWSFSELHESFKKRGLKRSDFYIKIVHTPTRPTLTAGSYNMLTLSYPCSMNQSRSVSTHDKAAETARICRSPLVNKDDNGVKHITFECDDEIHSHQAPLNDSNCQQRMNRSDGHLTTTTTTTRPSRCTTQQLIDELQRCNRGFDPQEEQEGSTLDQCDSTLLRWHRSDIKLSESVSNPNHSSSTYRGSSSITQLQAAYQVDDSHLFGNSFSRPFVVDTAVSSDSRHGCYDDLSSYDIGRYGNGEQYNAVERSLCVDVTNVEPMKKSAAEQSHRPVSRCSGRLNQSWV